MTKIMKRKYCNESKYKMKIYLKMEENMKKMTNNII